MTSEMDESSISCELPVDNIYEFNLNGNLQLFSDSEKEIGTIDRNVTNEVTNKNENSAQITDSDIFCLETSTMLGNTCVVLKIEDPIPKTICLNGKVMRLADGTSAFIQYSKNNDSEVYTPINLSTGSILYVLTDTLLNFMGDQNQDDKTISYSVSRQERNKMFNCTYTNCTKKYASLHHLKVHTRAHTGVRPFKCTTSECNKAFSTGFGLKTHLRTHNNERPYVCKYRECAKSFKTSGDLQKHNRTHTGERPFVCPVPECGRSFTTCNICKVHVRTHTGERPYKCTYSNCNKTFASVTNQRNHLRIHSGEKPYVCPVPDCGRRFTEYSSLYKHSYVHRPLLHTCTQCGKMYKTSATLDSHFKSAHRDLKKNHELDEYIDVGDYLFVGDSIIE